MLVISRRCGEKIKVGDAEIVILATGTRVKLGVTAPAETRIQIVKHTPTHLGIDTTQRTVVQ